MLNGLAVVTRNAGDRLGKVGAKQAVERAENERQVKPHGRRKDIYAAAILPHILLRAELHLQTGRRHRPVSHRRSPIRENSCSLELARCFLANLPNFA